jgi:hypothetical protein
MGCKSICHVYSVGRVQLQPVGRRSSMPGNSQSQRETAFGIQAGMGYYGAIPRGRLMGSGVGWRGLGRGLRPAGLPVASWEDRGAGVGVSVRCHQPGRRHRPGTSARGDRGRWGGGGGWAVVGCWAALSAQARASAPLTGAGAGPRGQFRLAAADAGPPQPDPHPQPHPWL